MTRKDCRKCEKRERLPESALCGFCLQGLNETSMSDQDE